MTDLNMKPVLYIAHKAGSALTVLFFKVLLIPCTPVLRTHILRGKRCGLYISQYDLYI